MSGGEKRRDGAWRREKVGSGSGSLKGQGSGNDGPAPTAPSGGAQIGAATYRLLQQMHHQHQHQHQARTRTTRPGQPGTGLILARESQDHQANSQQALRAGGEGPSTSGSATHDPVQCPPTPKPGPRPSRHLLPTGAPTTAAAQPIQTRRRPVDAPSWRCFCRWS